MESIVCVRKSWHTHNEPHGVYRDATVQVSPAPPARPALARADPPPPAAAAARWLPHPHSLSARKGSGSESGRGVPDGDIAIGTRCVCDIS